MRHGCGDAFSSLSSLSQKSSGSTLLSISSCMRVLTFLSTDLGSLLDSSRRFARNFRHFSLVWSLAGRWRKEQLLFELHQSHTTDLIKFLRIFLKAYGKKKLIAHLNLNLGDLWLLNRLWRRRDSCGCSHLGRVVRWASSRLLKKMIKHFFYMVTCQEKYIIVWKQVGQ